MTYIESSVKRGITVLMFLFVCRDLKKRLVAECDAITKAKRFLRRHKKSVQKRQAALDRARTEWKHDVTTNINRGKVIITIIIK